MASAAESDLGAEAAPVGGVVDELHHRLGVAEAQVEAAGVLEGEQPPLEALHGEGDRDAHGDRVDAEQVAQLVGGDDRRQVVDAARAAERVDRLVLRALGRRARVRALAHDRDLASSGWGRGRRMARP